MAYTSTAAERSGSQRQRRRARLGFSVRAWPFIKVVGAASLSSLAFYTLSDLAIDWQPEGWGVADRLQLFIKSAIFGALPAVAGILIVAVQRLNPDHFVGIKVKPYSPLDINTRFVQNTVEQLVLFLIGVSGLSLYITPTDAQTVPILAAMFLFGRLLHWWGFHKNTYLRAFGFGLTFYPMLIVYAWLVVRMGTGLYIPI